MKWKKRWSKDKRFLIEKTSKVEFRVYCNKDLIARAFSEYDARKAIWVFLGRPKDIYVDEKDFIEEIRC